MDRAMAEIDLGDFFSLYEIFHQATGRVVETNAFYVCLYSESDNTLVYHYLYDEGCYRPGRAPLGDGPTSWVVRHKKPFILTPSNRDTHRSGGWFGRCERLSASAVHLPMRPAGWKSNEPVLGVMSTQAYRTQVYSDRSLDVLQVMADRVATLVQRDRDRGQKQCDLEAAELKALEQQRQMHEMAEEMIRMTADLGHAAEDMRSRLNGVSPDVRAAMDHLCRLCYRSQTEASQLPWRVSSNRSEPTGPSRDPSDSLAALTEREREILYLLRRGETNAQIARQLFISVDTVKFHCNNLYRKLNVSNRVQATQYAVSNLSGSSTPTRTGR